MDVDIIEGSVVQGHGRIETAMPGVVKASYRVLHYCLNDHVIGNCDAIITRLPETVAFTASRCCNDPLMDPRSAVSPRPWIHR